MKSEEEILFYKELAKEIKPQGFRCFLYDEGTNAWLYVITPKNSWLYIDKTGYEGYDIVYKYKPSKDFGSGCQYNPNPLYEINAEILLRAERYGKTYRKRGWVNVPNVYDGGTHRESIRKAPDYYTDGYKAMMDSWHAKKIIEL